MQPEEDKNLDYQQGTVEAADLTDAARRENVLQRGERGAPSIGVLALGALILIFGGGQLFSTANGFRNSTFIDKNYRPDPRPVEAGGASEKAQLAWIDEWMEDGKTVYANCIACHQADGKGLPGAFPPLVDSEWVHGGTQRLAAIVLHGITGPFHVSGQAYNQLMPPWNSLTDEKLAQVLTYIRRTFVSLPEGEDGVVTEEMMTKAREQFDSHSNPFTEAELLAIPEDAELPGGKVNIQTGEAL